MHNPFYDITTGCNSNDPTTADSLTYYCANPATIWSPAGAPSNMHAARLVA